MVKGFITAMRLLTILPVPGREADKFEDGVPWYPAAGGVIGCLLYAVALAAGYLFNGWHEVTAFFIVIGSLIFTRALHLDGVADCADGFWGGHTKERRLEIMKDSRIGAFGVCALILLLLIKWIALTRISESQWLFLLPLVYVLSRFPMCFIAWLFPYARKEGTAGAVVNGINLLHVFKALFITLILSLTSVGFVNTPTCMLDYYFNAGLMLVIAILSGLALALLAKLKIGGVTGDVLGMITEMTEVILLLTVGALVLLPC